MATIGNQIADIIEELTRLQNVPSPYDVADDDFPLPRLIDAGNGGSLVVSRKLDEGITTVADALMAADPALAPKYTRAEWRASVRKSFGPALVSIDLDIDPSTNADAVLATIKSDLSRQNADYGVREYAFGCTLFGNTAIQPFSIGIVRFEGRSDWLDRKHRDGDISKTARRRIERSWEGLRLRKRRPSRDSINERVVRDTVEESPYVCSVLIDGLAAEAGRDKALTAVRLAMAAIALLWQTPSKTLEGLNLNFDRIPHRQQTLIFLPGVMHSQSSWSHLPRSHWLRPGEWEEIFSANAAHFRLVGEILACIVSPTGNVSRPRMTTALAQSLLWFHEGCRDPVSLMGIVKFSASLDALAMGGGAGGIERLVTARLGIESGIPIRSNGPTLRQAVAQVYREGRSRTVHGTNSKLGHDWVGTRGLAEQLTRLCLLTCIRWAGENPTSDDPGEFSR
ncbi:MAG: hypothetical protein Q8Q88_23955 [Phenylobacterium sp.]|uniref:hypothetical protein n=1 Tax=Phenylobacterium sp. TaxID=1871053 RepID=UPI002734BD11|nr:hypothetical protein [Phenylobacterium sp.]MDP3750091.1 hypothetical protein [Phenylobacterium sp.]